MAGGINKVILVGHLGKDPEVRTIESGVKVANFTMATTESYKDKNGERKDTTEWHNIVCWRNLAEIAEKYLTKGKQIYVEGKIRSRSWEDNGVKRYAIDIVADTFTMLGSKSDSILDAAPVQITERTEKIEKTETDTDVPPAFLTEEEDDLPF